MVQAALLDGKWCLTSVLADFWYFAQVFASCENTVKELGDLFYHVSNASNYLLSDSRGPYRLCEPDDAIEYFADNFDFKRLVMLDFSIVSARKIATFLFATCHADPSICDQRLDF